MHSPCEVLENGQKQQKRPIRILIADDHKIMRQGLRTLLERQEGMEIVAEAENGRIAVDLALQLTPDVVVMDVSMPELDGIEATRQITASNPEVKVIALSMHAERRFVERMMSAGASGYLLKDCAFDELTQVIRDLARN